MRRRKSGERGGCSSKKQGIGMGHLVGAFFSQLKGQEKIEQISVCGLLLNVPYVLNAYFVGEHYTEKQ